MVKARVISLTLLAPLCLVPTPADAGPSPRQTTAAQPAAARTPNGSVPRATRRPARSKERIYTYKPKPEAPAAPRSESVRLTSASDVPFVGFSPTGNSVMGVGLWRMPKVDSLDPNRGQPLRDMKGKTGKAAAVGFQLVF